MLYRTIGVAITECGMKGGGIKLFEPPMAGCTIFFIFPDVPMQFVVSVPE